VPAGRQMPSDRDVTLLALRLSVAVHHRQAKEALLRSLIEDAPQHGRDGGRDGRMKRNGRGPVSGKNRQTQSRW